MKATPSNNDTKFGGPLKATGTQWFVASMVNMTTGLPMKVPAEPNAYGSPGNFFPGAYNLGDILHDQGYEQTVMFGADANLADFHTLIMITAITKSWITAMQSVKA